MTLTIPDQVLEQMNRLDAAGRRGGKNDLFFPQLKAFLRRIAALRASKKAQAGGKRGILPPRGSRRIKSNAKEENLLLEIAALLYEKGSLSFGQAKTLAGLSHLDFQSVLKDRGIPLNYDVDAFHEDLLQLNEETKI